MSPGTDRPWNSAFQPDRGLGAFHSLRKAILAQRTQLGLDALKQCDEVLRTAQEPGLPEPLLNLREGEGGSTLVFDDPVYSIWLRFSSAHRPTGARKNSSAIYRNFPRYCRTSSVDSQARPTSTSPAARSHSSARIYIPMS